MKVERRGFIACLVGMFAVPFRAMGRRLRSKPPQVPPVVNTYVAGRDIDLGNPVYLAADGCVYSFDVIARTNLGQNFNGIATGKAAKGQDVNVAVSGAL